MVGKEMTNGEITEAYLEAVAALKSADAVGSFFAPDFVIQTFPNRISPHGGVRKAEQSLEAFSRGQKLLSSQNYQVRRLIEKGDEVAAELEWTGTLAMPFQELAAGSEIKAYVAMFLTFREGKIVSQRNYDCYPPFGEAIVSE